MYEARIAGGKFEPAASDPGDPIRAYAFLEHNQLASELRERGRLGHAAAMPHASDRGMRTNTRGQSALLLLEVVNIRRRENTNYAVIGAFALTMLGVLRASRDVDALLLA